MSNPVMLVDVLMLDSCYTCDAVPEKWYTAKVFKNIECVQWFADNCELVKSNQNAKTDWLMARHTAVFKVGSKYIGIRGDSYTSSTRSREYEMFEMSSI